MARIRTVHRGPETCIVFTGRLTAADMGRLEHACGPALTREPLRLQLDLRRVTTIDRTAAAMIDRLKLRGATAFGAPQAADADARDERSGDTTGRQRQSG
jgi:hypothetical protein